LVFVASGLPGGPAYEVKSEFGFCRVRSPSGPECLLKQNPDNRRPAFGQQRKNVYPHFQFFDKLLNKNAKPIQAGNNN